MAGKDLLSGGTPAPTTGAQAQPTTPSFNWGGTFGEATGADTEDSEVRLGSHTEHREAKFAKITKVTEQGAFDADGNLLIGVPVRKVVDKKGEDGRSVGVKAGPYGVPYIDTGKKAKQEKAHWEVDESQPSKFPLIRTQNEYYVLTDPEKDETIDDKKKKSEIITGYRDMANSKDEAAKAEFLRLQDRLYSAGFMADKPTKGVPDDITGKALEDALGIAARTGKTLDEVLDDYAKNNPNAPKDKFDEPKKVKRDIKLTNKDDIRKKIEDTAPNMLGQLPDDATISSLIEDYGKLETSSQNAVYDAQDAQLAGSTVGQTSYDAPDLSTFLDNELRNRNPIAARGQAIGNNLASFMSLLRGGGSGTASTFGGN